MPWSFNHIGWLIDTRERLTTSDGKIIEVWELRHKDDNKILSAWAKHFRNHYCLDTEIDELIRGTKYVKCRKPKCEYLLNIKFPDATVPPGPSVRSGDFGEILVADYVEYILKYWVPRTRFCSRINRNDPSKGVDVIGIKFFQEGTYSSKDILLLFESKCKFTGTPDGSNRLKDAIKDSGKDYNIRKAESLNAIKQWFIIRNQNISADKIERFQNEEDYPYEELSGAAALLATNTYDRNTLESTTAAEHRIKQNYLYLSYAVII